MSKNKAKGKSNNQLIVKAVAVLLSVVAAAYVVTSLALGMQWNPLKWGNKNKPADDTKKSLSWGGAVDGDGNEMNNVVTYAMPETMAFYDTLYNLAEGMELVAPSVTVTCTHNFELNNIKVDWSIEYPSGASASDVVTVTPESDGSTRATVQCSAPFDMQITLKASLRGYDDKTATCTIDYVKRISSFNSMSIDGTDFNEDGGLSCSLVFGVGSIIGDLKVSQVYYFLLDDFQQDVQSYLKFDIAFKSYAAGNLTLEKLSYENNYSAYGEKWAYDMFIKDFESYDEAHKNAIYFAWWSAFNNGKYLQQSRSIILLDVDVDVLYNGTKLQTFSETDYIEPRGYNYLSGETQGYDLTPDLTLNNNVIF